MVTGRWVGLRNDEYLYKWQIPLHITLLPVMQGITHLSSLYIKWMTYVFYRNIIYKYIYILEIYMENNIISLLYETQCPVFDSDCSLSLSLSLSFSFSLCRTFVCLLPYAVSVWLVGGRDSLKGSVTFYKDSSQVHGSNFRSSLFASSPVLFLFFPLLLFWHDVAVTSPLSASLAFCMTLCSLE